MIELGGEHLIAGRLFERIEIGALHVLDDRELERFAVADVEHDDRHFVQAGALRRAPAPFAGDDLEVVGAARAHHDRLDDAALADRMRELVQLGVGEQLARIARIGVDELDRHRRWLRARSACCVSCADVADQRGKAASQVAIVLHRPPSSLLRALHAQTLLCLSCLEASKHPAFESFCGTFVVATGSGSSACADDDSESVLQLARSSFSRWMISVASRR